MLAREIEPHSLSPPRDSGMGAFALGLTKAMIIEIMVI